MRKDKGKQVWQEANNKRQVATAGYTSTSATGGTAALRGTGVVNRRRRGRKSRYLAFFVVAAG
jgi:hypothetical protein